ncbi:hypothetical protein R3P38DRAFT_3516549 [Favolaschia claudopus]|uniref:Uncharacterized protein n=1 Tax=Favolaschia claudopus TaxID=2862362 RepID=A0AAV9ZW99_9AGAR
MAIPSVTAALAVVPFTGALNRDLWFDILRYFLLEGRDSASILQANLTCQLFFVIIQSRIYRHVNLRSHYQSLRFFKTTISRYADIVQTIQLSFDLDRNPDAPEVKIEEFPDGQPANDSDTDSDSETDESELDSDEYADRYGPGPLLHQLRARDAVYAKQDAYERETARLLALHTRTTRSTDVELASLQDDHQIIQDFWRLFCSVMPTLTRLTALSLSYAHDDPLFLRRFIDYGEVRSTLPVSLRTLHLKPLAQDYTRRKALSGPYAWHDDSWKLEISLIPHIETLILSTPSYVVWPPTKEFLTLTLTAWTAQIRRNRRCNSNLSEIVINSGFGDNGAIGQDWATPRLNSPNFNLTDLAILRKLDHFYGYQLVWFKGLDAQWFEKQGPPLQSPSNRSEYLFGRSHWEVLKPFMAGNVEVRAREWRQKRLSTPYAPGFGIMY